MALVTTCVGKLVDFQEWTNAYMFKRLAFNVDKNIIKTHVRQINICEDFQYFIGLTCYLPGQF